MPNDRIEIVKAYTSAYDADVGVERNYSVPSSVLSAGKTDVTYYANQTTPRDEDSKGFAPNLLKFFDELFIVCNVS